MAGSGKSTAPLTIQTITVKGGHEAATRTPGKPRLETRDPEDLVRVHPHDPQGGENTFGKYYIKKTSEFVWFSSCGTRRRIVHVAHKLSSQSAD